LRMHKTAAARSEADRLVAERPDNAKYRFALGNAMLQQHAYSAAAEQYREALRLDPGNASDWHNLGVARLGGSRLTAARDAFEQALKRDRDPLTMQMLGQVYKRMHQFDNASACYAEALNSGMLPATKAKEAQDYLQQLPSSAETGLHACQ